MQVSKSLILSGIRRAGGFVTAAGLPATTTPQSLPVLSFLRVPRLPTNHDVVAASQGVH